MDFLKIYGRNVTCRGFHKYKKTWCPEIGERLQCTMGESDFGGIAVKADGETVGHLTRRLTKLKEVWELFCSEDTYFEVVVVEDIAKRLKRKGEEIIVDICVKLKEGKKNLTPVLKTAIKSLVHALSNIKLINVEINHPDLKNWVYVPPKKRKVGRAVSSKKPPLSKPLTPPSSPDDSGDEVKMKQVKGAAQKRKVSDNTNMNAAGTSYDDGTQSPIKKKRGLILTSTTRSMVKKYKKKKEVTQQDFKKSRAFERLVEIKDEIPLSDKLCADLATVFGRHWKQFFISQLEISQVMIDQVEESNHYKTVNTIRTLLINHVKANPAETLKKIVQKMLEAKSMSRIDWGKLLRFVQREQKMSSE